MIKEKDIFIRADGVEFYVSEINNYPTSKKNFVFYRLRMVNDYDYPYHDYSESDILKYFKRKEN